MRGRTSQTRILSAFDALVRRPDEEPKGAISNRESDDAGHGVHESHWSQRKGAAADGRGVRDDGPVHGGAGQGRNLRGRRRPQERKRSAISGAGRTVIDGPFAKARDLVAGFSIWEVKDMDEAVAWAKRSPKPMPGPSEIEIRPFHEAADLAEFLTPE